MAIGKKTGGRDFQKGRSGNPSGRPKLPVEIKESRKLTSEEFLSTVNRFLFLTPKELDKVLKRPTTTVFDLMIGTLVQRASQGDYIRAQFIVDRILGKPRESLRIVQQREEPRTGEFLKEIMNDRPELYKSMAELAEIQAEFLVSGSGQ